MKNNQTEIKPGRGGPRPGAGRKAGSPNIATAARQAEVAASGETPLDYMLRVMRDEMADEKRRDDMAKAAAAYTHPKLSSIAATVEADLNTTITHIERRIVDPSN